MKCPGDQAEKVTLVVIGRNLNFMVRFYILLLTCRGAQGGSWEWWRSEVDGRTLRRLSTVEGSGRV